MVEIHLNLKDRKITSVATVRNLAAQDNTSRQNGFGEIIKRLTERGAGNTIVRNDNRMVVANRARTIIIFTYIKNYMELLDSKARGRRFDEATALFAFE
jgi:hypothetical protein